MKRITTLLAASAVLLSPVIAQSAARASDNSTPNSARPAGGFDSLFIQLTSEDPQGLKAGLDELKRRGAAALEPAMIATEHEDARVRCGAAVALGYFARNVPEVAARLSELFTDADIRLAAVAAFSRAEDNALPVLADLHTAISEGDAELSALAVRAAAKLRLQKALTAQVIAAELPERDRAFAIAATEALAHLGSGSAGLVDDLLAFAGHDDARIRRNAVAALGT